MYQFLNRGALLALALSISGGAHAATNWQDLKVGGGGYVRGLVVHADGTLVGRTDTAGAYLWNGSSWAQLVTSTSMPASYIASRPIDVGGAASGSGVYEIAIAPQNSSLMYMNFGGLIWSSTNKGTTWTQTNFPAQGSGCNPNDSYAQTGQKMAVDPNNSNIVYAGTETNGMYVTRDGGVSWTQVSGVPVGAGAGVTGILFYPGGGQVGGVTQVIYASSNGHGVYKTVNGGATWTLLSGGPVDVENAAISNTGIYYAVGDTYANVWGHNGTSWTKLTSGDSNTWQAIAINPFNQNELVVSLQSGTVNVSYNAGSTWTGKSANSNLSTNDIPWLLQANSFQGNPSPYFYLDAGGLQFSPTTNGLLYLSGGTGMWRMNVPASGATSSTALTWTDFSVGIENLVANTILVPPVTGSVPILASWDRPFFKITNPTAYPSTYGPVNSDTIQMGWSLDYASSSPGTVVGLSNWNGSQSGTSTDGGTTWTHFSSVPSTATGGEIAATTPQNIIIAPTSSVPYYTTNQGASWTAISVPGISNWGAFHSSPGYKKRGITADRVLPNTFYLYYGGYGVFKSTDGGAIWTNVYKGNNGYIDPGSTGFASYNAWLSSVPGNASQLFYTGGWQLGGTYPVNEHFYRSIDGGATWTAVPNVMQVTCFGFGAPAPGQTYPAIYIAGFVNNIYGVWQSIDNANTWTQIGTYPLGSLVRLATISGDPNIFGQVYAGFDGGGYAYLPGTGTQVAPVPMAPSNLTVH
jgi:hypothetical protein